MRPGPRVWEPARGGIAPRELGGEAEKKHEKSAFIMGSDRIGRVGGIPACAVLSPAARIVLGCLEILDEPTVDGLADVTGLSSGEVRRCISELHAVGESSGEPA